MARQDSGRVWRWPTDLQGGVVTRAQALEAGVSERVIDGRLKRGEWQRLQPGVYATFSGPASPGCLQWAAVLRAGPRAVLSYQTAAQLWRLPGAQPHAIHVTVPRGSPASAMPGVIVHYSMRVAQARHAVLAPPRTTVEETVLDLACAAASGEDAVAWVVRALATRQTTRGRLVAALGQRRRMRWRAEVTGALDPASAGVHSILEHRYLTRVERPHGLPAGKRQWLITQSGHRKYADVAYDHYATLVELDGQAAHPEASRRLDTARDNANAADGWVTLRYGYFDVTDHACEVAAQVAAALRRRGWTGHPAPCSPACSIARNPALGAIAVRITHQGGG